MKKFLVLFVLTLSLTAQADPGDGCDKAGLDELGAGGNEISARAPKIEATESSEKTESTKNAAVAKATANDNSQAATAHAAAEAPVEKQKKWAPVVKIVADFIKEQGRIPTQKEIWELAKARIVISENTNPDLKAYLETGKGGKDPEQWTKSAMKAFPELAAKKREVIRDLVAKFVKEYMRLPKKSELKKLLHLTSDDDLNFIYNTEGTDSEFFKIVKATTIGDVGKTLSAELKQRIVNVYIKAAKQYGRSPSLRDIEFVYNEGKEDKFHMRISDFIGKDRIFDSEDALHKLMWGGMYERQLKNVVNTQVHSDKSMTLALKAIDAADEVLVTSFVAGSPINLPFFYTLENYCKKNNAIIAVVAQNGTTTDMPAELLASPYVHVITHSVLLSQNFIISDLKTFAKQLDPNSGGVQRIGERGMHVIIASPKMNIDPIPSKQNEFQKHMSISTGTLSLPVYSGKSYASLRTDEIAYGDHKFGAVLLKRTEVQVGELGTLSKQGDYSFTQIEFAPETNGFHETGTFYGVEGTVVQKQSSKRRGEMVYTPKLTLDSENRPKFVIKEHQRPESVDLGDFHSGDTEQRLLSALINEIIIPFRPKRLALHDVFNGKAINRHNDGRLVEIAKLAESGELNLVNELRRLITFLNNLLAADPEMVIDIILSNHNEWLTRFVQEGWYNKGEQAENRRIGAELHTALLNGNNVLRYAIENWHLLDPSRSRMNQQLKSTGRHYIEGAKTTSALLDPSRIIWGGTGGITVGPDYNPVNPPLNAKYEPLLKGRKVQIGMHGDEGANGVKNIGIKRMRVIHNNVIYGHTHQFARQGGAINVGTGTTTTLPYSESGASSWTNALAITYADGMSQPLIFKNGHWILPAAAKRMKPAKTFPYMLPKPFSLKGQFDQYNQHHQREARD